MIYKRGNQWHIDVTVNGERYRESLQTSDRREALGLEKKRVGDIQKGKVLSSADKDFARTPFREAAPAFVKERIGHVAERTIQFESSISVSSSFSRSALKTFAPTRSLVSKPDCLGRRSIWRSASCV